MIVRSTTHTLQLITQPDHAALAARIMRTWGPLQDAPRRASVLLAIEEHDNGWREPDETPSVDAATGAVHDFVNIPAEVRRSVWPRGIARLGHEPWAAALVAQHALTVYDRFRADASWTAFFTSLAAKRDDLLHEARGTRDDLESDYQFVRIGDLVSLIFCNQWNDETFGAWRFTREGERVHVAPDPFAGRDVPIAVTAREIPNRPYASDDDLQRVVSTAPAIVLRGVVAGAP